MLRYGMMASKGHSVSLPNDMKIATHLPLLPEEVGIVVLKRNILKSIFLCKNHIFPVLTTVGTIFSQISAYYIFEF